MTHENLLDDYIEAIHITTDALDTMHKDNLTDDQRMELVLGSVYYLKACISMINNSIIQVTLYPK